mgnify:CR=1 FL=1
MKTKLDIGQKIIVVEASKKEGMNTCSVLLCKVLSVFIDASKVFYTCELVKPLKGKNEHDVRFVNFDESNVDTGKRDKSCAYPPVFTTKEIYKRWAKGESLHV